MTNLIGKEVIGACGVMNPELNGAITGEETHELFGSYWVVTWDNGNSEKCAKHSVKPISERRGCGVYYV